MDLPREQHGSRPLTPHVATNCAIPYPTPPQAERYTGDSRRRWQSSPRPVDRSFCKNYTLSSHLLSTSPQPYFHEQLNWYPCLGFEPHCEPYHQKIPINPVRSELDYGTFQRHEWRGAVNVPLLELQSSSPLAEHDFVPLEHINYGQLQEPDAAAWPVQEQLSDMSRFRLNSPLNSEYGLSQGFHSDPLYDSAPHDASDVVDTSAQSGNKQERINGDEPYAKLIHCALMAAPRHSMSLQEIYHWFRQYTNKGVLGTRGWMNSIRHNLSMNQVCLVVDVLTLSMTLTTPGL